MNLKTLTTMTLHSNLSSFIEMPLFVEILPLETIFIENRIERTNTIIKLLKKWKQLLILNVSLV